MGLTSVSPFHPLLIFQVVYGARNGSDGSGTIPRRVGKLVEEDLQRLKALEPTNSLLVASPQWGGAENLEVRNANPPRLHASRCQFHKAFFYLNLSLGVIS